MTKGWGVVIVLAIAVLVVFGIALSGLLPHSDDAAITGLAPGQTATFEGQNLQLPEPWHQYLPGSRGSTLTMKKAGAGRMGPTLTLEDERRHPEDVQHFLSGWMNAKGNPGFRPASLDEFHDTAVDQGGMRCVSIHWPDAKKPLQLVCIASNGRWKLTLIGTDSEIPALDAVAQQMPGFVRNQ